MSGRDSRSRGRCAARRMLIEVRNPDRVCTGVKSIEVDGASIPGNIVPYFDDGQTHRVIVDAGSTTCHDD